MTACGASGADRACHEPSFRAGGVRGVWPTTTDLRSADDPRRSSAVDEPLAQARRVGESPLPPWVEDRDREQPVGRCPSVVVEVDA